MRIEDVKIGMKVVPHSKSKKTTNLEYSCVYCNAKKKKSKLFICY